MTESTIDKIAERLRKMLDQIPELQSMPEKQYCETVLEGIDIVTSGIQMRLEELDDEDDEMEE